MGQVQTMYLRQTLGEEKFAELEETHQAGDEARVQALLGETTFEKEREND